MALSLGSALATKVYLGATEVSLAYLGATQVYTSSAFSAEAQDYFDRLDTAGDTTYVDYKQPLANYIDSLVALGGAYWDDMESAASFVGVGIQGVTVPLRDGMPTLTNNNFVAGDLNTLTGLLSDGSTKYLATGLTGTDLSQNDHSLSVYASSGAITGFLGGTYSTNFNRPIAVALVGAGTSFYSTGPLDSSSKITSTPSLVGLSRSASTEFTARTNQGDETFTRTSGVPNTGGLSLYAVGAGVAPTVARLATYHAGPALNLATLEGLQATLITEIAAASPFSAEAQNYFDRLDTAGDTTYTTYKQPLANYIDSLVALGGAYWDDMLSATSFVGVGIQGITVPLRDGMTVPTNNNFVAADLDQLTGLKGGNTKELATGISDNQFTTSNASASVYATEAATTGAHLSNDFNNGAVNLRVGSPTFVCLRGFNTNTLIVTAGVTGLIGLTRNTDTDLDGRASQTNATEANAGVIPRNKEIFVLSRNAAQFADSRLATYHLGPALNLATLEGLQATLISEIAAI